ncbi:MAG: FAD-dependent monooxygenase [Burkholderiaceae bacterium]|nr:FAD-dependent monooxygenase [Burkholderiaceae bacterium]
MPSALKVLVVGGGIGGMSTAITLRQRGHEVELIDLDPQWRVYGAGITITGATFRAFSQLGILDEVLAKAWGGPGIQVCDMQGRPLAVLPTPPVADADVPGTGGLMRPVLHAILSQRTLSLGTRVRLGLTVDALQETPQGTYVQFSDGSNGTFDLVVGADGLFSRVRQLLFPDAPAPEYTGQSVWRTVAPRASGIDRRHFFLGGPVKVGLTPVSDTQMYMFLLETTQRRPPMDAMEQAARLRSLLAGYGGPLATIRESLDSHSDIVLRPLEAFVLPPPWHAGRTLLIGDAAHPTTPQLASGAGMAVEDALVLAQELDRAADVASAFEGFMARRHARCRLVVENSLSIGRHEQQRAPVEQQTRIVEESLIALARPI